MLINYQINQFVIFYSVTARASENQSSLAKQNNTMIHPMCYCNQAMMFHPYILFV